MTLNKRFRLQAKIVIAALIVAGLCGVLLFPDLADRWFQYNMKMINRVLNRLLPFVLINFGVVVSVFIFEALIVGWQKSSLNRTLHPNKTMLNDLWMFLVSSLQLDYVIVYIATLGIARKLENGFEGALGLQQGFLVSVGSPALQLFLYIIIADLAMYLTHYLHHRLSFLWAFHSYHHSATEMNILTATRSHPIQEEFTNTLIILIPMALLGVPLPSLMLFRILRNGLTFLHHSKVKWYWGWFGKYVVVSPGYHQFHHSVLPEHFDKNLAVLFPVWDHLFGTYYDGPIPASESGIPQNQYNKKSFWHDMWLPFKLLFQKTTRRGNQEITDQ